MFNWLKQKINNGDSKLISVVINTRNEEKNIKSCIESVTEIADEIIVVDMQSNDQTQSIAKSLGAKVYEFEAVGYVEPGRNFAISKASLEWILVIDADERFKISDVKKLRTMLANNHSVDAFYLVHKNKILNKWLKGTGWGEDKERHLRLFRRAKLDWPKEIHSTPKVAGVVSHLSPEFGVYFEHYNYDSIGHFFQKFNKYTTQEAIKLKESGFSFDAHKAVEAFLCEIASRYQPELDGVHSFNLAIIMGFYRYIAWAKLWEIEGYPDVSIPNDFDGIRQLINKISTETKIGIVDSIVESQLNQSFTSCNFIHKIYGFYPDEGGWRWGSKYASIEIEENRNENLICEFNILCSELIKYENKNLILSIYVNGKIHSKFSFVKDWQSHKFSFALKKEMGPTVIKVEASCQISPTKVDLRNLAFIIKDFNLKIDI